MYHSDDTIAAIASASGGAARGIVRISGPSAIAILESCFRPCASVNLRDVRLPTVHSGTLATSGSHVAQLPVEVYLWPDARSYTRQPSVEIHGMGSPPLLSAMLKTVCAAGARLAEPGEFTLRAFLAGRLDLTQAEAVLGIINARGQQEFRTALEQLAGGLARPLNQLRDRLLDLLAHLEAGLDFVEDDIQFIAPRQIELELEQGAAVIAGLNAQLCGRKRTDEPPRAVLVGRPNVGKSSLFNALAKHAGALVSDQPGTTRDYLTTVLDLGPARCQLIDTAGVEPEVPASGISRVAAQLASSQEANCDIRLLCIDSSRPLNDWERRQLAANQFAEQIVVVTKCEAADRTTLPCAAIDTSAKRGLGLDALRRELCLAAIRVDRDSSASGLTAERCGESLRQAGEALVRARQLNESAAGEELIAAEVRLGLGELGMVVGAVYTDDILDRVFSRFCIGK